MKINIYTWALTSIMTMSIAASCSNFLEEKSQDEIKPQNVKDYKELIAGEIYSKTNLETNLHTYLDIMTDDCEEFAKKARMGSDTRTEGNGYFTWQKVPEIPLEGSLKNDIAWDSYYHQILVCNMILHDVDKMIGSDKEKQVVKAEALMSRAYAYYMLVNLYGEPYDPDTADKAMGVPKNDLIGAQNKQFKRESVQTIYELIISDATQAIEYFQQSNNETIFRWNLDAAKVFIARVYAYMQIWDKTISYASDVIDNHPILWNLNDKNSEGPESSDLYYFNRRNPEILFSFGNSYIRYFAVGAKGAYPASTSLTSLYKSGDLRCGPSKAAYIRKLGSTFMGGGKRNCPYKSYDSNTTNVHGFAIRNTEAYLLRAEALSHTPNFADAMKDIEKIRINRFEPSKYEVLPLGTQEETIQLVRNERRMEMCFEQLRWFDLRRWDRPRIVHTYTKDLASPDAKQYFVLEENDPAYTLPVPTLVYEKDTDVINVDRPERIGSDQNPDLK